VKDGSKDFGLKSLDETYVRGLCRPQNFHGVRRSWKEDHVVYRQFVLEGKFRPPTKERSEETKFCVEVSLFQSCVGVNIFE
jgi:hypothetical protein